MSKKIKFLLSRFRYSGSRSQNVSVFIFDRMTEFNLFVTTILEQSSNSNVRRIRDDILVNIRPTNDFEGTTDRNEMRAIKERFRSMDFIKNQIEVFRTSKVNNIVLSFDNKKTLKFNDRDLGIFSFDLASAGLHKVKEYYSSLLKIVVDANEVKRVKDGDKFKFIYTGTPEHEVEQRDKLLESGLPKLKTSTKKVFIDIPKPKKALPQIDIFINISFYGSVKPDQMRWNALVPIAIAEKLNSANIGTRIWAITDGTYSANRVYYSVIKVKDFSDPLDINSLAIMSADSRFYRYDFFKGDIALPDYIGDGNLVSSGLGAPITDMRQLKQDVMNAMYEFEMYDLPDEKIMYEETKVFIKEVFTENDASNEFTRVMDFLNSLADKYSSPDGLTKWKPTDTNPNPTFTSKEKTEFVVKEPQDFTIFRA